MLATFLDLRSVAVALRGFVYVWLNWMPLKIACKTHTFYVGVYLLIPTKFCFRLSKRSEWWCLSHPYEACFVNTDGSYLRLHLLNSSPPMISIGQVSEQQTTNKWQNLAQGRFPSYFLLSHSSGQSHSTFRLFLVSRPLFSWRLTRSDQTGFPKKFHPQKKSKNTNFPKCSNLQIFEVSDRRSTLINNNNQSTHTWLPGTLLLKKDG